MHRFVGSESIVWQTLFSLPLSSSSLLGPLFSTFVEAYFYQGLGKLLGGQTSRTETKYSKTSRLTVSIVHRVGEMAKFVGFEKKKLTLPDRTRGR